jgi:Protein of unknown function (DUF2569)
MSEDAESFLGVKSPADRTEAPRPLELAKDSPYYGYGGWLVFFCIVVIFVAPLFALISGAVAFSQVGEVADRYPSLLALTFVELIGGIGVVIFGVVAGLKLRRLQRGAVGLAKGYLIARLVWAVLTLGLPAMGGDLPSEVTEVMMIEAVKGLVQAIIGFAIWFSYFNVSKRIKATFPEG